MLLTLLAGALRLCGFIAWAAGIEARLAAKAQGRQDQALADDTTTIQEAQHAQSITDEVGQMSNDELNAKLRGNSLYRPTTDLK